MKGDLLEVLSVLFIFPPKNKFHILIVRLISDNLKIKTKIYILLGLYAIYDIVVAGLMPRVRKGKHWTQKDVNC